MLKKTDANQAEIVRALRSVGVSVQDTSAVGQGFPDLVCAIFGKTYLIEIKNPDTYGKLNTRQIIFRDSWKGRIDVVNSVEEALRVVGVEV